MRLGYQYVGGYDDVQVQSRSEQAENLDAWLDSVDKGDQDSTYQNEEQRKKAEKLHAEFWGQGDDVDEDTQGDCGHHSGSVTIVQLW